ncbi:MAG: NADH-quinone oxidoreductase subunit A, partial [Elusimicrobiota bacterium]
MLDSATIAIFAIVSVGFAVLLLALASLLRAKFRDDVKETVYECGMPTQGDTEIRTNMRFYTYALLFVLFDVETLYLYPWAVGAKDSGLQGLAVIGIFVGMLLLGLF